jgi:predicted amidophosphoribosyltransferase
MNPDMGSLFARSKCTICGRPIGKGEDSSLCDSCQRELGAGQHQAAGAAPANPGPRKKPGWNEYSIFCPNCHRPNYPDGDQCWHCGSPLHTFKPAPHEPAPEIKVSAHPDSTPTDPSSTGPWAPGAPQLGHLVLSNISAEEVVGRFRRAWIVQVLEGPVTVILILAFYLARAHWGGLLGRISGAWVAWGLIAIFLVVGAINYRCPRCHRSFFLRRMGHLRSCPRCGAAFELPEQAATVGGSPGRLRRWVNNADHRLTLSRMTPLLCLAIMVATPYALSASEGSSTLALASPAVIATVTQSSSQPPQMTSYTDRENGFSFDYPASWEAGGPMSPLTNSKLILRVCRLNPSVSLTGNLYTNVVRLYYFRLDRPIDATSFDHQERVLERDWRKAEVDVQLAEPWHEVSIGGLSGIEATRVQTYEGELLVKTDAFLFDGTREFQLEAQATLSTWPSEKAGFDAFFRSFRATNPAMGS